MTRDQSMWLATGGLAVVCLVLVVACLRLRVAAGRTADELAALRERVDDLTRTPAVRSVSDAPVAAPMEFVITDLGQEPAGQQPDDPVRLDGPAFADIVLKETVVKAASLAHGVRRGLAPATRNRIRFEMRQELRRSRKQRRRDVRAAQRLVRREAS